MFPVTAAYCAGDAAPLIGKDFQSEPFILDFRTARHNQKLVSGAVRNGIHASWERGRGVRRDPAIEPSRRVMLNL